MMGKEHGDCYFFQQCVVADDCAMHDMCMAYGPMDDLGVAGEVKDSMQAFVASHIEVRCIMCCGSHVFDPSVDGINRCREVQTADYRNETLRDYINEHLKPISVPVTWLPSLRLGAYRRSTI
jgi:hypothetical protein